MRRTLAIALFTLAAPVAVLAHHGWGSYDASKLVTVEGPIQTSSYTNPHATITVKAPDKTWTVTLRRPRACRAARTGGACRRRQDRQGRGLCLQGRPG